MASLLASVLGLITLPLVAVFLGILEVPVPYPGTVERFVDLPEGALALPREFEGPLAKNDLLTNSKLVVSNVSGVETVAVSDDGDLYLPDKYGNVWRATLRPCCGEYDLESAPVAGLGAGRPLGSMLDKHGNLLVVDALKGLLKVEAGTNVVSFLATHMPVNGTMKPITFANDLDIASDGTVYFTSSQTILPALCGHGYWDMLRSYQLGVFSGEFKGRLLRWSPATRAVELLSEGYWYANGVALAADESFVAFTETNSLRVMRYWIKGPKAGTVDVLVDRLPGFPDGIDRSSDGGFWISLVAPVSPVYPHLKYKALRTLAAYLPQSLNPPIKHWGCVVKVDKDGKILLNLMDYDGHTVSFISAATEHDGKLFLGNLAGDTIHMFDLSLLDSARPAAAEGSTATA